MSKSSGSKRQKTVHLVSLGCAKNLVDSEIMLGEVAQAGYAITADPDDADIIIINTCGFVRDAIDESYEVIEDLIPFKTEGNCERIVVTGCLAQRFKQDITDRFPEIDALVGTSGYKDIVKTLTGDAVSVFPERTYLPDHTVARLPSTPPWTAYLRIAEGCDNRCSYCMIPSIRGPYRSREISSLVKEAEDLIRLGVKELILIAQDTTLFGYNTRGQTLSPALPKLLSSLEQTRIQWIRIMYSHPARLDDELLGLMAGSRKILPYLDIPIQHSHPEILRAMNRPDDSDAILDKIAQARKAMPDICIRTTLLVGFPGERQKHIDHLAAFVKQAEFDRLGVFKFSQEAGAPAAMLQEQVPEPAKAERYELLMETQQEISLKKNRAWVGRELDVLIESPTDTRGVMAGRSFRDAPDIDGFVFVEGKVQPGEFARVKIRQATHYDLVGQPIGTSKNHKSK